MKAQVFASALLAATVIATTYDGAGASVEDPEDGSLLASSHLKFQFTGSDAANSDIINIQETSLQSVQGDFDSRGQSEVHSCVLQPAASDELDTYLCYQIWYYVNSKIEIETSWYHNSLPWSWNGLDYSVMCRKTVEVSTDETSGDITLTSMDQYGDNCDAMTVDMENDISITSDSWMVRI